MRVCDLGYNLWSTKDTSSSNILGSDYLLSYVTTTESSPGYRLTRSVADTNSNMADLRFLEVNGFAKRNQSALGAWLRWRILLPTTAKSRLQDTVLEADTSQECAHYPPSKRMTKWEMTYTNDLSAACPGHIYAKRLHFILA